MTIVNLIKYRLDFNWYVRERKNIGNIVCLFPGPGNIMLAMNSLGIGNVIYITDRVNELRVHNFNLFNEDDKCFLISFTKSELYDRVIGSINKLGGIYCLIVCIEDWRDYKSVFRFIRDTSPLNYIIFMTKTQCSILKKNTGKDITDIFLGSTVRYYDVSLFSCPESIMFSVIYNGVISDLCIDSTPYLGAIYGFMKKGRVISNSSFYRKYGISYSDFEEIVKDKSDCRIINVFQAISDLGIPPPDNKKYWWEYSSDPQNEYQFLMRTNRDDSLMKGRYSNANTTSISARVDMLLRNIGAGFCVNDLYYMQGYSRLYKSLYKRLPLDFPSNAICKKRDTSYHPVVNRIINVRELFRIKTIPDWFLIPKGFGSYIWGYSLFTRYPHVIFAREILRSVLLV